MGPLVAEPIERYLASLNRVDDPVLLDVARAGEARDLRMVSAEVGAFLEVMARTVAARRLLEVGTGIGYSTLWLARALAQDGHIYTIEIDPDLAREARETFDRSGLSARISVMVGEAARLVHKVAGPFDFIFQGGRDTDDATNLDRLVDLLRPGGILVADNALAAGRVGGGFGAAERTAPDGDAAVAAFNQRLARHPRLRTTVVPLGDGLSISVKVPQEAV